MEKIVEKRKNIAVVALKENKPNFLVCKTGRMNAYRWTFYQGVGASSKDKTFDPKIGKRGGQKCCGSKVWWRHKVSCKNAVKNSPDDLSDLKEVIP